MHKAFDVDNSMFCFFEYPIGPKQKLLPVLAHTEQQALGEFKKSTKQELIPAQHKDGDGKVWGGYKDSKGKFYLVWFIPNEAAMVECFQEIPGLIDAFDDPNFSKQH